MVEDALEELVAADFPVRSASTASGDMCNMTDLLERLGCGNSVAALSMPMMTSQDTTAADNEGTAGGGGISGLADEFVNLESILSDEELRQLMQIAVGMVKTVRACLKKACSELQQAATAAEMTKERVDQIVDCCNKVLLVMFLFHYIRHTHTQTLTRRHRHTRTPTHTHTHACADTRTHRYTQTHSRTQSHKNAHTCAHADVEKHTRTYTRAHTTNTHIYPQTVQKCRHENVHSRKGTHTRAHTRVQIQAKRRVYAHRQTHRVLTLVNSLSGSVLTLLRLAFLALLRRLPQSVF